MPKSDERKQIEANLAYWQVLADLVGWRVLGFTGDEGATFLSVDASIHIPGWARDDIVYAIQNKDSE